MLTHVDDIPATYNLNSGRHWPVQWHVGKTVWRVASGYVRIARLEVSLASYACDGKSPDISEHRQTCQGPPLWKNCQPTVELSMVLRRDRFCDSRWLYASAEKACTVSKGACAINLRTSGK